MVVEYIANVFNEVDKKEEVVKGVTIAESLSEAVDNLEKYYGSEMIDVKICGLSEDNVYEFDFYGNGESCLFDEFKVNIKK